MIADQIGNFWSSDGPSGLGRFADSRALTIAAAKDSLHGHVADAAAIKLLVHALDADNACVRRVAAKLLGRSRAETAQLTALLNDPNARVREAAAYSLARSDRKAAHVALETTLRERGPAEAAMAAWALGEIEDSASVPALERATTAADARMRLAAVDALGNIKDASSLATLRTALAHDASATVRARAAHAIGDIGEEGSIAALSAAIDDPALEVQYAAVEAIKDVNDLHVAPASLIRAARSSDARLRDMSALALAEVHDPATIETLMGFIGSDNREVRRHVARALGEIGSPKASDGLVRLLKDSDPQVRKAATEALGEINRGN
jgi:HEAT repeat protein